MRSFDRATEQGVALEHLLALYETLRSTYAEDDVPAAQGLPTEAEIAAVQSAAMRPRMYEAFFRTVLAEGDVSLASVALTRKLVARSRRWIATSIAQVFQRYAGLSPIGDICLALCALDHPMPETAWELLTRNDLDLILRLVPEEYLRLGFAVEPEAAAQGVRRILRRTGRRDSRTRELVEHRRRLPVGRAPRSRA